MFPNLEFIKTALNGLRSRIEKVERFINQALAQVKAQVADIIQDIKNVRIESAEAIKSSTADWSQNDSNALDYVKNRTHYVLPTTPIGSLEFIATAFDTIEYTVTLEEAERAIFQYFTTLRDKGEVLKVIVGDKEGLLAVSFDRGRLGFSGVFTGRVSLNSGNVLSLVAQNDFITFNQGDTYAVSFEDTTKPYYSKLDFNYLPDNVYHSENAPVKFGDGENSAVQGNGDTTATDRFAHAEGSGTTASGYSSHAEGGSTTASGHFSHAEGSGTTASGYSSHAEGDSTTASGGHSHAEGYVSEASGDNAHAEGDHTVANRRGMHAEGKYNLYDSAKYVDVVSSDIEDIWRNAYAASEYTFDADTGYYTLVNAEPKSEVVIGLYYANSKGNVTSLKKPISLISGTSHNVERHVSTLGVSAKGKYVRVVGNGDSSARSNAYTLDWDGNAWYAGDVFVGGNGQDEGVKLLKSGEAIPIPQTAAVGQTIVVKAVDESGKPTEWEAVDYLAAHPIQESDPTVSEWAKQPDKPSYTPSEVGADPSGTAASQVASHNTGTDTHSDIRLLIQGLTDRLNALADSDDTTLDQLSEVVAYIKNNRELIAAITTDKVSVANIIDNLTTNVANKPLSAAQGVALKALIDAITIPEVLPNPNALTFTGAVSGSYDGSEPLTVNIPSSGGGLGGGGGLPNWRLIKTISFSADISYAEFDADDDGNTFSLKEIMLAGSVPAYSGYIYMKPNSTGVQNSIWPTASKDVKWWAASVNGKLKTMLAVSNASVIWPIDKDPVCENDTISRLGIGASGGFTADGTMYVYGR